jgi:voltage-gated sodium channel
LIQSIRDIVSSTWFGRFTMAVILFNAVLVGIETSATAQSSYGTLLHTLDRIIQAYFVVEITMRLVSFWPRPQRFFREGWNLFDFAIVAASFLPAAGPFATVARLARILRVLRLVTVSRDLRLIVVTMLKSIPSMGHVIILLALLLYVYGVFGFHLFHTVDPENWGTLGRSLLTLFEVLTLEGWVELQETVSPTHPWAWIYFGSFVVLAVFITTNLFIAVVTNNLQNARAEDATPDDETLIKRELIMAVRELRERLDRFDAMQKLLEESRRRAGEGEPLRRATDPPDGVGRVVPE